MLCRAFAGVTTFGLDVAKTGDQSGGEALFAGEVLCGVKLDTLAVRQWMR